HRAGRGAARRRPHRYGCRRRGRVRPGRRRRWHRPRPGRGDVRGVGDARGDCRRRARPRRPSTTGDRQRNDTSHGGGTTMSVSAETFGYVADLVRTHSAIQLAPGKEYLVESRLLPLAREKGLTGPAAVDSYVRDVRRSPDRGELTRVVEALTTNETSWFRDTSPFAALRQHIAPAARAQNPGTLRVWSAACSTGQEPYSIAMTLLETGERRFSVLATDLSTAVLAQAQAGQYSQLEMNRGLPAAMLVRYFERAGAGWGVKDELRRAIT